MNTGHLNIATTVASDGQGQAASAASGLGHCGTEVTAVQALTVGVALGAEDGLEVAVREACQLILKAMPIEGIADGTVFPSPADAYHPVEGTDFVANSEAGVLAPFPCLRPMAGVAMYQGKQVLVVGPWFVSFDQLCLHGFLSSDEVTRLMAASKKIERDLYRVMRRKGQEARARVQQMQNDADSTAQSSKT